MQPNIKYRSKPKTSKPTSIKPRKPKGAGAEKTVRGKEGLPKANKRGM